MARQPGYADHHSHEDATPAAPSAAPPTAPKKTRQRRQLGAGEAADRVQAIRRGFQAELEAEILKVQKRVQERLDAREADILAHCSDPDRARAILAMGTEEK